MSSYTLAKKEIFVVLGGGRNAGVHVNGGKENRIVGEK